ncbi:hypothetical protein D3C87_1571070 [compost metagenome]
MQPRRVVPGFLEVGRFHPDQRAEVIGVLMRKLQHDAPADRATDQRRAVQRQGIAERHHGFHVAFGGQAVFLVLPAGRRVRLAVPGHVESNHAITRGDVRIAHHVAVLAAVGARGMQADQRNALARFLEIDAAGLARDFNRHIAANNGFQRGAHACASRPVASRSLMNCRCAIRG